MIERKVEPIEPDSPERCQSGHRRGQCVYKRLEGSNFCAMHGGGHAANILKANVQRAYQLAKWQDQTDQFADDDAVKSLRGEIGILRLLLQQVVSRCKDSGELVMMSGKIGDLITKIERLVVSCHRLESNMGQLLDKTRVLDLAAQMVTIISNHVTDDDLVARISDEIVLLVSQSQGISKEEK